MVLCGVQCRLEIITPLVHLGVDFRGGVRVRLSMIDRLVAQFNYETFDFGMSNKEL